MEGTALVQGIIHMADTLGIRTVAEGVERQEQADVLRWLGSTEGQGFGFSPPVSGEQITRFGLGGPDWPIIPGGNGGVE
jgi:EAL domain-containing protein (putative c-di-GMP-specific phosphodiesterase class I)